MQSKTLRYFLDQWPGKQRFGIYRFLPIFFVLGAALEFSMVNWTVGQTSFCKTFSRSFVSINCNCCICNRFYLSQEAGWKACQGGPRTRQVKMPAGVNWPTYLKFFTAAMLTMMAGSQSVHIIYQPLQGMDDLVQQEITRLKKEMDSRNVSRP